MTVEFPKDAEYAVEHLEITARRIRLVKAWYDSHSRDEILARQKARSAVESAHHLCDYKNASCLNECLDGTLTSDAGRQKLR